LPLTAIIALWALAGSAYHSTTPLLWWAVARIGPWLVCTAVVSQCHQTICASCRSLRTLDRRLRILTAGLTFLLGAVAFFSTIQGGTPSYKWPGLVFGISILIQTAGVALVASWFSVTVFYHVLARLLVVCASTGFLSVSNVSSPTLYLLIAGAATMLCLRGRRQHRVSPARASFAPADVEAEILVARMSAMTGGLFRASGLRRKPGLNSGMVGGLVVAAVLCPVIRLFGQERATNAMVVRVGPEARIQPAQVALNFRVAEDGTVDAASQSAQISAWVRALPNQRIRITASLDRFVGPDGAVPASSVWWSGTVTQASLGGRGATFTNGSFGGGMEQDLIAGWQRSGTLACTVTFSLAHGRGLPPGTYAGAVRFALQIE